MITPIVSSAMYSTNRRAVLEAIPPKLRKLWKDWDLRVTILLSLIIQILLSILGNHRKHSRNKWIGALLWAAYTAADSVAIFALGIISNNISDMLEECEHKEHLNPEMQLSTFWAQFLVLHLGGPDSITAYALEDNELWMRQLLGLATQTCGAVYVILLAWTSEGSSLSILSILMFIAGFIKYGERIYVLRAASYEIHRNSVLEQDYRKFSAGIVREGGGGERQRDIQEYRIKISEGYTVGVELCYETNQSIDLSGSSDKSHLDKEKLVVASGFLGATKRVFVDASVSSEHRDRSRALFRCISSEDAFQINEIQLGMIFDSRYTKAKLLHSRMGLLLRLVTIFLVSSSLVFFTAFLDHKDKYPKMDVFITFLLLVVAFLLEVYAVLVLIFSDKFALWLIKRNKISTLQTLNSFQLLKSPRWSNSMSQYVLFGRKRTLMRSCSQFLNTETSKYLEWNTKVTKDLKEIIFRYFKEKAEEVATTRKTPSTTLLTNITTKQEEEGRQEQDIRINWEDFEYKIIVWSIVTEVFYYLDREHVPRSFLPYCKAIKRISRYLLYLLVWHPSLISAETGFMVVSFEEVSNIMFHRSSESKAEFWKTFLVRVIYQLRRADKKRIALLKKVAKLAIELQETADQEEKWERIGNVWLELLGCAATKSKGIEHAKQLGRGGAFITHVWLLMVNFGLTHHFVSSGGGNGVDRFITK